MNTWRNFTEKGSSSSKIPIEYAGLWVLLEAITWQTFCIHCGSVPFDRDGDHLEDCPTCGTCAQCEPTLEKPWHKDEDWLEGERFTVELFRKHLREVHGRT